MYTGCFLCPHPSCTFADLLWGCSKLWLGNAGPLLVWSPGQRGWLGRPEGESSFCRGHRAKWLPGQVGL